MSIGAGFAPVGQVESPVSSAAPTILSDPQGVKDELPPKQTALAIDVSGNGTVVSSLGPAARRVEAGGRGRIRCGVRGFLCYATFSGKQNVTLQAKPAPGFAFESWGGACFGQKSTCTLQLGRDRAATANFEPAGSADAIVVRLDRPRFQINWRQSIGSGRLYVSGQVSKPALLRVEMRRPFGGPLVTQMLSVSPGRFRLTPAIARGLLPKGALVLPGGFVVSVSGKSGGALIPRAMRTLVLPPPPEGVVRRAYVSATKAGTAVPGVPANASRVWANFAFAAQPQAGKKLTVRWYWPDGRLLLTSRRANRPVVSSGIGDPTGAPMLHGRWRVELRAGGRLVKTLTVPVG
jgi:hypothetical protein